MIKPAIKPGIFEANNKYLLPSKTLFYWVRWSHVISEWFLIGWIMRWLSQDTGWRKGILDEVGNDAKATIILTRIHNNNKSS